MSSDSANEQPFILDATGSIEALIKQLPENMQKKFSSRLDDIFESGVDMPQLHLDLRAFRDEVQSIVDAQQQ